MLLSCGNLKPGLNSLATVIKTHLFFPNNLKGVIELKCSIVGCLKYTKPPFSLDTTLRRVIYPELALVPCQAKQLPRRAHFQSRLTNNN